MKCEAGPQESAIANQLSTASASWHHLSAKKDPYVRQPHIPVVRRVKMKIVN